MRYPLRSGKRPPAIVKGLMSISPARCVSNGDWAARSRNHPQHQHKQGRTWTRTSCVLVHDKCFKLRFYIPKNLTNDDAHLIRFHVSRILNKTVLCKLNYVLLTKTSLFNAIVRKPYRYRHHQHCTRTGSSASWWSTGLCGFDSVNTRFDGFDPKADVTTC